MDPDPYSEYGSGSTQAKDLRYKFTVQGLTSLKYFFRYHFVLIVFKTYVFKRKLFFSKIIFGLLSLNLEPDPNSLYLDPQHCTTFRHS